MLIGIVCQASGRDKYRTIALNGTTIHIGVPKKRADFVDKAKYNDMMPQSFAIEQRAVIFSERYVEGVRLWGRVMVVGSASPYH